MALFYGSYVGYAGAAPSGASGNYYQGENYGYAHGGGPGPYDERVQKYSISSGGHATEVGVMTQHVAFMEGHSSATYGYRAGGGYPASGVIDKTQFASDGDSVAVTATLSTTRTDQATASSETQGFCAGGYTQTDTIEKYTFASESAIIDHGNLTATRYGASGFGSITHGYSSGGHPVGTQRDKYSYASDAGAANDGDQASGHQNAADGCSSQDYGWTFGGTDPNAAYQTDIDKFAFESGGTASVVAALAVAGQSGGSLGTPTYGYQVGGSSTPISDTIQRWEFASDGDAVDTTYNLRAARCCIASSQY